MVRSAVPSARVEEAYQLPSYHVNEFGLDIGARILSGRLKENGIDHIHEEFDDGHFNISYRYDRSLELISKYTAE